VRFHPLNRDCSVVVHARIVTLPVMTISCGFPPSRDVVQYAQWAEEIGYERIWLYDSPALYGDIWVVLGRIAERTSIGIGTAVAVPSLRHVMVTASAIATLEELAPGRLACAFGSGFTARCAMGRRPMKWSDVAQYVRDVRALLNGEIVHADGAAVQMLHSPGYAPARPITVPLLLAPVGPKGFAAAAEVGDGVMVTGIPEDSTWKPCVLLTFGTVLDDGEDHTSRRVQGAAGPWFVTGTHAMYEWAPAVVDSLPGGPEWRARIEAEQPEGRRHLAVHEGHVVTVTERDRPLLEAGGAGLLDTGWTGPRDAVRARYEAATAAGVTDVLYTPTGPDIRRELAAFASAVSG
jgi:5,10-methylenetetrahydromethanopterin reductase